MFIFAKILIEIDYRRLSMKRNSIITCKGRVRINRQAAWVNKVGGNINRLYYINSGKGSYLEGGVTYPLEAGKFYFIPSYAGISTYTDESDGLDHTFANCKFSPPIVSNKVFCLDPSTSPALATATATFCELCKNTYNARSRVEPLTPSEEKEFELLKALTVYLTECAIEAHPDYVLNDSAIITALDVIHSNVSEKLSVSDIAESVGMSTDGFIRKFRRYIGETPYSYIKQLKLQTALTLRAEGASLEDIADACGYSDPSSLLHAITFSKIKEHKCK